MLLNSGTPSLLSYTRDLAGDPASAASEVWNDARVTAAINDAYLEMREVARVYSEGVEFKRTYADSVLDQIWYEMPSDFKRIVLVEVDTTGGNLSTSSGSPTKLKPIAQDTAFEGYGSGAFTGVEYVVLGDEHFAILAPPTVAGTASIRLAYEAQTAALVNDTDEPTMQLVHQNLICYKAAVSLRASEELEHNDLMRLMMHKERIFRIAMQDRMNSNEDVMSVVGLADRKDLTRFGRYG